MTAILLVSHGALAEELLRTAELIVGEQEDVHVLGLQADDSLETFVDKVQVSIRECEATGDDLLVFVDLFGGTPSNAVALATRESEAECLAGVNLPILLEALLSRDQDSVSALVPRLLDAGKESIIDVRAKLSSRRT